MTAHLSIRPVVADDLPEFFEFQLDPDANRMAAFTAKDPTDHLAFLAHWRRILSDPDIVARTIEVDGIVVGNVSSFPVDGNREVSYWIGRPYWGRGYATAALAALVAEVTVRPLRARAAKDNIASLTVLDHCGFRICGEDRAYAAARDAETDEYVLELTN